MTHDEIRQKTIEMLNSKNLQGDDSLYYIEEDIMDGIVGCMPQPFETFTNYMLNITRHFIKLNCFLLTNSKQGETYND